MTDEQAATDRGLARYGLVAVGGKAYARGFGWKFFDEAGVPTPNIYAYVNFQPPPIDPNRGRAGEVDVGSGEV